MIVECNSCSTKYRVREEKLPEGGGNIKCPNCAKVFFVKPPAKLSKSKEGPTSSSLRKAVRSPGEALAARVGTMPGLLVSGRTGAFPKFNPADMPSRNNTTVPRQAAIPSDAIPPVPEPEVDLSSASWKLKTSFGLVYDFPDTESLRNWLSGRDDLSGYMLSHDAQNFQELKAYIHLFPSNIKHKILSPPEASLDEGDDSSKDASTGGKTSLGMPTANSLGSSAKGSTSGQRAKMQRPNSGSHKTSARPVRLRSPKTPRPPPLKKTPVWVIPVSLVLLAALLVFGLHFAGVINIGKLFGTSPPPVVTTPTPVVKAPVVVVVEEVDEDDYEYEDPFGDATDAPKVEGRKLAGNPLNSQNLATDLLNQAREEISNREYDTALDTLLSAKGVDPQNPEVYRMLDRVYSRRGDNDAARAARDKLTALLTKEQK